MNDQQRAELIIRIAKIVFCALAAGLFFAFGGYYRHSGVDANYAMNDTMPALKLRFEIGLCVGAVGGAWLAFRGNRGNPGGY